MRQRSKHINQLLKLDPQAWIWAAISLSVLICVIFGMLYIHQRQTTQRTLLALDTIRQARLDLAHGFLHITLAQADRTSFDRERGLALLEQALNQIQATHDEMNGGVAIAEEVATFRQHLAVWLLSDPRSPEAETVLRVAFHQVEQEADVLDQALRQNLRAMADSQQTVFTWTLGVAVIMLTGVCVILIVMTRARQQAEGEREAFAQHNLALIAQVEAELEERIRAEEEVRRLNAELEERVALRTAELADANRRLEALNAFKDNLLAVTSHDLRSPLGMIINLTDMVRTTQDLPERARRLNEEIELSARQLLDLVGKLLDLSRLEAGKIELECEPIYLSQIVTQSIDTLQHTSIAKQIDLRYHIDGIETMVCGDGMRLYQLINNLLSNAIKFTRPGGIIEVGIATEAQYVLLSVRDTGLGIPADALPHLFDKFRQIHRRGTANEYGSGLGLAIVRQLVDLHRGTIEVTSVLEQGSTFVVRIPIARAPWCQDLAETRSMR
ncbi:sensor histidine kinase [Candidatus Chloroploca asiatica]|uniref:Circadian input-output histidine kinase CikA n=1 Tax=Candidatus Chloroploca asiatica TaxID=1506545 RepID=A0A2H3KRW5_9CHLR|nr:HAMP domain-containing sensor histidine kinase [Candidatus Chloroploca asiatica]PDW00348.1 hypothetical protein A9Q02_10135 [Candidatus Chloroploca asiatica]